MANIAIIGATGLVGQTMLEALETSDIYVDDLTLYASKKSAGTSILFKGSPYYVQTLSKDSIDPSIDYALFSAGSDISKAYAPYFKEKKITIIDNSSAFRSDAAIPLIVPEVNPTKCRGASLIANPNCSTIQAVLPLHIIHKLYGIKRINYVTLQAVSGAGYKGLEILNNDETLTDAHAINDNVIPKIDVFEADHYTFEETKMIQETKKIFNDASLNITATCIRVPVTHAHGVNITVETHNTPDLTVLETAFNKAQGIQYYQHPTYPTPQDARGQNDVLVGRLRLDKSAQNSIHLWTVADNIRKGAAYNAVQILKQHMEDKT